MIARIVTFSPGPHGYGAQESAMNASPFNVATIRLYFMSAYDSQAYRHIFAIISKAPQRVRVRRVGRFARIPGLLHVTSLAQFLLNYGRYSPMLLVLVDDS